MALCYIAETHRYFPEYTSNFHQTNEHPKEAHVVFGVTPSETQVVSKEVKALGYNLLRQSSSAVSWIGTPTTIQANYALYTSYISAFICAASSNTFCNLSGDIFRQLPYTGDGPYVTWPTVVVNWSKALPEEVADDLRKKGFRDMMIRGKPCMVIERPTRTQIQQAMSTKCSQTAPCVQDTINIVAFKTLRLLQRILGAFIKTNQYPAFQDEDHESEYQKLFKEDDVDMGETVMPGEEEESSAPTPKVC